MGTYCAPLVADVFLFCYEREFMVSLSDDKQADVIDAFNTTSRYLDDISNINNVYFDNIVGQIYPSELQLNRVNTSDIEAAFLDLHLSISNDIVSTKIYDKRDYFDFEIVNFQFLDGDVPRSTSYGVYISHAPDLQITTNQTYDRQPIVQLITALQFWATGNFQRECRDVHCLSKSSVSRCIGAVSKRYSLLFSTSSKRTQLLPPSNFPFFVFKFVDILCVLSILYTSLISLHVIKHVFFLWPLYMK